MASLIQLQEAGTGELVGQKSHKILSSIAENRSNISSLRVFFTDSPKVCWKHKDIDLPLGVE